MHVLPYIGTAPLVSVDAGTLNALYARLLAEGRKDHAGGGLSPRTVRYVHTITHRALKDAVKWGRLARNAADAANPPSSTATGRPDSVTWTADQLRTFLDGTRKSRHSTAYLVLATTGLRRGEALGLRWRDLDLDAGRASIRQTVIAIKHTAVLGTPKTAKGRRTVTLDAGTVAALREHRKRQAAERLQMGAGWTDADLGVLPGRRHDAAPRAVHAQFLRSRAAPRAARDPASRLTPWLGDARPAGWACTPRSCRNALGTRTSASRSIPTAT